MTMPHHSLPPEVLKALKEKYFNTVPEKLTLIENLINEMSKSLNEKNLTALRTHIHQMAGSAGTFGYPQASVICKQFEKELIQKLEEIKKSKADPLWVKTFKDYLKKIKDSFK